MISKFLFWFYPILIIASLILRSIFFIDTAETIGGEMVRPFPLGQILFKENQRIIMSLYESIYESAPKKANLKNEELLHFLYHIEKTLGIPDVHIAPLNIPNLLFKKFPSYLQHLPHGDIGNYVIDIKTREILSSKSIEFKSIYYPHENGVH